MPYDEHLADRIRQALKRTSNVDERRMFGGLCFFVDDKMCINLGRRNGIMQRCLPVRTSVTYKARCNTFYNEWQTF